MNSQVNDRSNKLAAGFSSKTNKNGTTEKKNEISILDHETSQTTYSNIASLNQSPCYNKFDSFDAKKWQIPHRKAGDQPIKPNKAFRGFYFNPLVQKTHNVSLMNASNTHSKSRDSYDISFINALRATPNINETPINFSVAYNESREEESIAINKETLPI